MADEQVCLCLGHQVVLNWLVCQGNVAPIPGAKNAEQARELAGALGWSLTAEEVEEDVYALTGARPRRRPRKRPRVVQRQLDVRPIPHTAPRAPPFILLSARYAFSLSA